MRLRQALQLALFSATAPTDNDHEQRVGVVDQPGSHRAAGRHAFLVHQSPTLPTRAVTPAVPQRGVEGLQQYRWPVGPFARADLAVDMVSLRQVAVGARGSDLVVDAVEYADQHQRCGSGMLA